MDTLEASQIFADEVDSSRAKSYAELVQIRGETITCEKIGPSGALYVIEVEVRWDARAGGAIRVIGGIDDGEWRAFAPLTRSFVKETET
jgi:hypothetical protein